MSEKNFLSIVIPLYNEAARIPRTIEKIIGFCKQQHYTFNIILVDDGSTDATVNIVQKYQDAHPDVAMHILRNTENHGKGFVVKQGMLYADGEIVLFTDADLSTPIEEFEKLKVSLLENNIDIAIGSRNIDSSSKKIPQKGLRNWMGKTFSYIVRYMMFPNILDSQCGFKAFKKHCIKNIFEKQTIPGFGFDPEILYIALTQGYVIDEVSVIWENNTQSKVNIFRDPLYMLANLILLRVRKMCGFYKQ